MVWFNTYESDGDGLTRIVKTEVDLKELPLAEWTLEEVGFRLAVLYPQVDGMEHINADPKVVAEVKSLLSELKRRGYDPHYNLMYNERNTGMGWLAAFHKLTTTERKTDEHRYED